MGHLQGPVEAQAVSESRHRQLTDVITSEFQRALAANGELSIVGKRGEAVDLLEYGQEALGGVDAVEAAEGWIVLVKATNNQFDGIVGLGNEVAFDGIDQFRPVSLQEIKDGGSFRLLSPIFLTQSQDLFVAFLGGAFGFGPENLNAGRAEGLDLGLAVSIPPALDFAAHGTDML